MPHTFLFADLAGFTALTEAHGDEEAADIAEAFVGGVRALLPEHDARAVKTMGDAVMVHLRDAESALCLAECIIGDLGARHGALGVRVGMHTGPAVERHSDWFGATVNIAARVADQAETDEALLTGATLAAARAAAHETTPLGPRRLKNVSTPVELHSLHVPSRLRAGLEVDPVCRMAVLPGDAAASVDHAGRSFHFCSAGCAEIFAMQPALYAERQAVRPAVAGGGARH